MNRGAILDFEVYLLVGMKWGMINLDSVREAKLAEHGLSWDDASPTHQRIAELLADGPARFRRLQQVLGITDQSMMLTYRSVLWPDFDFLAVAGPDGDVECARFRRARGQVHIVGSPLEQQPWTMDQDEFARFYGPVTQPHPGTTLFHEIVPAHFGYEFERNNRLYGAGFCWGLYTFSALVWT